MMNNQFQKIPKHVAIIMDGNGRWAQNEGRERLFGHFNGVNSVREVVKTAHSIGVEYLTLYAFSTENWGRPTNEVDGLMQLVATTILEEVEPLKEQNIKFHFIGNLEALPKEVQQSIDKAMQVEVENVKLNLVIALNYSSRWEVTRAVRQIVESGTPAEQISEQTISDNLQTSFMPDPDLLIRTSGEERISNFLLWQISYSELYFTPVLWPEFDGKEFLKAIDNYNKRDRRFGLTK